LEEILTGEIITIENAIEVITLPEIRERLQSISTEVKAKVDAALALDVSEETLKLAKTTRTALNKNFIELENKRIDTKNLILQPYVEFEALYKNLISDIFRNGLNALGIKINDVEDELRNKKERAVNEFFMEYSQSRALQSGYDLGFISLGKAGVSINLTASLKSLKEQVKTFIDKTVIDLEVIENNPNRTEILCEYQRLLDLALSISVVERRHKEIEEQKAREEKARQEREERKKAQLERERFLASQVPDMQAEPEPLAPPTIIPEAPAMVPSPPAGDNPPEPANAKIDGIPNDFDPIKTLTFTVTAPLSKLRALKQFLINGGYTING